MDVWRLYILVELVAPPAVQTLPHPRHCLFIRCPPPTSVDQATHTWTWDVAAPGPRGPGTSRADTPPQTPLGELTALLQTPLLA